VPRTAAGRPESALQLPPVYARIAGGGLIAGGSQEEYAPSGRGLRPVLSGEFGSSLIS